MRVEKLNPLMVKQFGNYLVKRKSKYNVLEVFCEILWYLVNEANPNELLKDLIEEMVFDNDNQAQVFMKKYFDFYNQTIELVEYLERIQLNEGENDENNSTMFQLSKNIFLSLVEFYDGPDFFNAFPSISEIVLGKLMTGLNLKELDEYDDIKDFEKYLVSKVDEETKNLILKFYSGINVVDSILIDGVDFDKSDFENNLKTFDYREGFDSKKHHYSIALFLTYTDLQSMIVLLNHFRKEAMRHKMNNQNIDSDYTEPHRSNVIEFPNKPGRNDPCPCGSGKKYKKCCWGKDIKQD